MYKAISISIFIIFSNVLFCQPDSLKLMLQSATGTEKLNILQLLTGSYLFVSTDSCVKYGTEAVKLAQQLDDIENEALANKRIGYAFSNSGSFNESLKYYKNAKSLFTKNKDYLDAAVITNFFGVAYSQLGDYDKAIEYFVKAEKSCDTLIQNESIQTSVKRLYAILFTNIGLLYHKLDSLKKPLAYFESALSYANEIDDSARIAASYSNIGMIYKSQEKYDKAFVMYFDALNVAQKIGHRRHQSAILNNIAGIYRNLEKYDSAMTYFKSAKEIILETSDKYGLSLVNRNIASVYLSLNEDEKALHAIRQALVFSKEIASQGEIYMNYKVMSDVYDSLGYPLKAFKYYILFARLRDSVSGAETREKIASIQTKFETEKKEKENTVLRKENQIKEITISQKNTLMAFMAVVSAIGFVLLMVILYLFRLKSKAYQALVGQNLKSLEIERKLDEKILHIPNDKILLDPDQGRLKQPDDGDSYQDLKQRFERFLVGEKPFLWSEVSLDEFSKKLNTNRTYLSKVINENYNQNFHDLMCEYRIRTARDLITNPANKHISVEGIGQMAGFKSNSTFHKKFKSLIGLTPAQFRNKALKK